MTIWKMFPSPGGREIFFDLGLGFLLDPLALPFDAALPLGAEAPPLDAAALPLGADALLLDGNFRPSVLLCDGLTEASEEEDSTDLAFWDASIDLLSFFLRYSSAAAVPGEGPSHDLHSPSSAELSEGSGEEDASFPTLASVINE